MMDQLIQGAIEQWEWAKPAFQWIGTIVSFIFAIVLFTPTKKDDAWLEELKSTPIIGPFLASVIRFNPFAAFLPKPPAPKK